MTLQFPTLAEQAKNSFLSHTGSTKPVQHFALSLGGVREPIANSCRREFHFPDDTTLVATGTGANLKLEALLP